MSIGDRLKEARQESGLSFKEIQDSIKVRTKYLQALEEENYKLIPGEAYVRAFIKGYGNFLGLNGQKLVEDYKEILKKEQEILEKELEQEEGEHNTGIFGNKIVGPIIFIIVLLVIIFVAYNIFLLNQVQDNSDNVLLENTPPENTLEINQQDLAFEINDDLGQTDLSENNEDNPGIQSFDPENQINSSLNENTVTVLASKRSWVQVMVDGKINYEGIMERDQSLEFEGTDAIELKIGNAAGIKVKKGEQILGPWGNEGEVIRKVIGFNNS